MMQPLGSEMRYPPTVGAGQVCAVQEYEQSSDVVSRDSQRRILTERPGAGTAAATNRNYND